MLVDPDGRPYVDQQGRILTTDNPGGCGCCKTTPCPSYYIANKCSTGGACPGVPQQIAVCSDAECDTGGPLPGRVILVGGVCYVVDGSKQYGDPPLDPLPAGVPIFTEPVFFCMPSCAAQKCQDPFGYFNTRECQCNAGGNPALEPIIPCEVYWQYAGLRCPYGVAYTGTGIPVCVVPQNFIPGPYPSNVQLITELFEGGCCACCNNGCNGVLGPPWLPPHHVKCDCWELREPWVNHGAEEKCCCGSNIQNTARGTLDNYSWDSVTQRYYLFIHVEYAGSWPGKIREAYTYFDPAGNPIQSGVNEYESDYGQCDPQSIRPFSSSVGIASVLGDPCLEGLCGKTCETFTIIGTTSKPASGGQYSVVNLTYTSNRGSYTQNCDECGTENRGVVARTPGDYL